MDVNIFSKIACTHIWRKKGMWNSLSALLPLILDPGIIQFVTIGDFLNKDNYVQKSEEQESDIV